MLNNKRVKELEEEVISLRSLVRDLRDNINHLIWKANNKPEYEVGYEIKDYIVIAIGVGIGKGKAVSSGYIFTDRFYMYSIYDKNAKEIISMTGYAFNELINDKKK